MSFQIRNIREIPGDSLAKFANELSKKLSRFLTKDQLIQLEDKEDIYTDGQDFDVAIKLHDELLSTKQFAVPNTILYYPPIDPGTIVAIWLRGRNLGNELKDWSNYNNFTNIWGNPQLINGTPFDYGIHGAGVKSIAMRFNSPNSEFENDEYIKTDDESNLTVSGAVTGMSYFVRFRIHDLTQQNGIRRTVFEKIDDATPSNGVRLSVSDDGKWVVQTKKSDTHTIKETAAGSVQTNVVYDVFVTFTFAGNVQHLYVAKIGDGSPTDMTLNSSAFGETWQGSNTDFALNIFRIGPHPDRTEEGGYLYGDFYDFKIYNSRVLTSTEIGRHWTNKWSISNIPYGQVIVANYWATAISIPVPLASFTTDSFTSTSFTV